MSGVCVWGGGCDLLIWMVLVFEGEAHPYKENLIKFNGRIRRREPEVKTEVLKQRSI